MIKGKGLLPKMVLAFCMLFTVISVFAQKSNKESSEYTITGRLTDSVSKQPLEYATISIFPEGQRSL